jgi:hypothetical protein
MSNKYFFLKKSLSLKNPKHVPIKSKIITLYPFLDKDQISRVGGILQYANVGFFQKHPIILSNVLMRKFHIVLLHGGNQLICIKKCVTCTRHRAILLVCRQWN